MRLFKSTSVLIGILTLVALLLAACQTTPETTAPTEPGIGVSITDDLCPNVVVQVGQQITWTNEGKEAHLINATSTDGSIKFESGTMQTNDTFAFTFSEADTYTYTCSANNDGAAIGTITVNPST